MIFSFEAKPSKIIEKSSNNYHFFIIVFFIRLKIIIFVIVVFIILFVLSGHQPPSHEISLSANHPGKRAEGDSPKV